MTPKMYEGTGIKA